MGKRACIAALLMFGLLSTGCAQASIPADQSTATPIQASVLGEHLGNPHVRGIIDYISVSDGYIHGFFVEGVVENDTEYARASVGVTETTRIYIQTSSGYQIATPEQLSVGVKVEVLFTSNILEIYPVEGLAAEIMILP